MNNSPNLPQFFDACVKGDLETVVQFIAATPHAIDHKSAEGWTGLVMACFNENIAVAKYLIANGADVNATNAKGTTIFMYAKTPIQKKQTETSFLAYLLAQGANINALNLKNKSVLDYVIENDAPILADWLIQQGAKSGTAILQANKPTKSKNTNVPINTYYLLFYQTIESYIEKRQAYRAEHLSLLTEAKEKEVLIMAGAFASPADGALLIFKTEQAAKQFAENDPYVKNGLISNWYVRAWSVVVE